MKNIENKLSRLRKNVNIVNLYFIEKTGANFKLYKPSLNFLLNNDISGIVIDSIVEQISGKTSKEFDPIVIDDNLIEYFNFIEIPNANQAINDINNLKFTEGNIPDFSKIWAYLIEFEGKISGKDYKLYAFRKFSNTKTLKKGSFLKLQWLSNSFEKLENEIFTIDSRVDGFVFEDKLYVLNKYYFEILFNLKSYYQSYVDSNIQILNSYNIVTNFNDFITKCKASDRNTKRLVKIIQKDNFSVVQSNISNIPNIISDFNLGINFSGNQINFNPGSSNLDKDITEIIDLLSKCHIRTALDNEKHLTNDLKDLP